MSERESKKQCPLLNPSNVTVCPFVERIVKTETNIDWLKKRANIHLAAEFSGWGVLLVVLVYLANVVIKGG